MSFQQPFEVRCKQLLGHKNTNSTVLLVAHAHCIKSTFKTCSSKNDQNIRYSMHSRIYHTFSVQYHFTRDDFFWTLLES